MASAQPGSSTFASASWSGLVCRVAIPVVALCFLPLGLLTGCGGSDAPPTPNGAAQAQPADPAAIPENAPADAEAPVVRRKLAPKPAVAATETQPTIDPSVNPHDVFEVDAPQPTFERAQGLDGPASANSFEAAFPAKGSTSSDFQLAEAPQLPVETIKPDSVASPAGTPEHKPSKRTEKPTRKTKSSMKSTARDEEKRSADDQPANGESKKSLPAGFRALPSFGYSNLGWPLRIRSQTDGAEMALVTGGAVTVGHDGDPPESSPQITVVLDSFYMDRTEVTLEMFERYRKALNEERGKRAVQEPVNAKSPPDFPVLGVLWKQAEFYAHWAHKDLPTEAEWERAARGETAFAHPWGNGRAIWSRARARDTITAVKTFPTDVSPFGIYDLGGNAQEWCSDRWSPTAFAEALKSSHTPLRNWKGARNSDPADFHVVKGNGLDWNAWYRTGMNGTQHHPEVGFRCVLRLNEKN
jgi:formylglycine-generating enzyme required for sulfatase activity